MGQKHDEKKFAVKVSTEKKLPLVCIPLIFDKTWNGHNSYGAK